MGKNLGQLFNSWCVHILCNVLLTAKRPSLKLKTRPKQLLGYLPHNCIHILVAGALKRLILSIFLCDVLEWITTFLSSHLF
jgi:hypothetical protein